jgi:hypothetical protein
MCFRKFFWNIQKLKVRILYFLFQNYFQISTRQEASDSIKILVTTNVNVGLNHYKNLPGTNFRRVLEISNSILNPKTGILWLNKKLIKESSYWDIKDLQKWEPYSFFPKKLDGSHTFLPDNGFFHLLIEDLPRYIEANNFAPNLATITGSHASYITDILKIINPKNYITINVPVKVDSIILSEKISGQIFSKHDLQLLRDTFYFNLKPKQNRDVFISRRDKIGSKFKQRGIDNRLQLEEIFSSFRFEIVYLEDLSMIEQIALISGSERIAGFHGAGLANIIWANSARIIEITKTRKTRHFEHLSEVCSHDYNLYSTLQPVSDLYAIINKTRI